MVPFKTKRNKRTLLATSIEIVIFQICYILNDVLIRLTAQLKEKTKLMKLLIKKVKVNVDRSALTSEMSRDVANVHIVEATFD